MLSRPLFISFMHCPTCDRESTNRRVCPFCFTPYPPQDERAPAPRRTTAVPRETGSMNRTMTQTIEHAAAGTRDFVMKQSPMVRWSGAGIALVLMFWILSTPDSPTETTTRGLGGAGTPVAARPVEMTREAAIAYIQQTRNTALVEAHNDEVFVSFNAATFPLLEEGQVALVLRFAAADSVVEGRKRRIFFYNPNGRVFAQSDAVTGVTIK